MKMRNYIPVLHKSDYIGWHAWAKKMNKTHKQVKCKGCGLYKVWVKRKIWMKKHNL